MDLLGCMYVCLITLIYANMSPELTDEPASSSTQVEPKSSSQYSVTVMARMSPLICSKKNSTAAGSGIWPLCALLPGSMCVRSRCH